MNIEEVLKYAPSYSMAEEGEDDESEANETNHHFNKKRKIDSAGTSKTFNHGLSVVDIDKIIEDSDRNEVKEVNENDLKRLISLFERRLNKNQEMRIKHSDNPSKFMDSELELFDTIKEMHTLSTHPALYEFFINQNTVPKLLGLLSHENTDIACAVVELIEELTDLEDIQEIDQVGILIDTLIDHQIVLLLVNNMERLDEKVKEESEGIHNSLEIIENLTDYNPKLGKDSKQLLSWLLKKLKSKPQYNANKLYSSEILNILLQNSEENRIILGTLKGIDILLHVAAYYKRHDANSEDEEEYMANLFNCICSSLQSCEKNRELFYNGEGLELMNLILKEKRPKESNSEVRVFACKVLNHCLSTEKMDKLLAMCCDKFIEILGLRVLMPIFQKPNSIIGHRRKKRQSAIDEVEEHTISILLSLLRNCKPDNVKRIMNKFVELNMVKTERLVELFLKYTERLTLLEDRLRSEGYDVKDEETREVLYPRLMEGGLFQLQLICHTILIISNHSNIIGQFENQQYTVKERIHKLLNMYKNAQTNHLDTIRSISIDYSKEKNEIEAAELVELVKLF
ncbi:hypothetical protein RDWZM_005658 [Blomia tropicalis]|uniref:Beta-catenin-like protein 1 n=1 Tax=Blomia tropicalis TaxID=40697 RepID=A0A9Q0RML5_BLOTA|nr:hypothetical protein RDWZM_005658 [Blomia tropicalis]